MKMKKLIVFFTLSLFISGLHAQIRKACVAGTWYPAGREELNIFMDNLLSETELAKLDSRKPLGLVSPHAGLAISGGVAACGYALLQGLQYDTVILLGSSHHYFKQVISIYNGDFCETPLGQIPINREITERLLAADERIVFDPEIHAPEHSLEAQLPFLQKQLSAFRVVLILTSTNNHELLKVFEDTLFSIVEENPADYLLIASTDLSHDQTYDRAVKMDKESIALIADRDLNTLTAKVIARKCELCGYYALYPFIGIMNRIGTEDGHILKYANSGDVFHNRNSRIVGYASLVFYRGENKGKEGTMTAEQKKFLLNLARSSIDYKLKHNRIMTCAVPDDPDLTAERAVFVTLHKHGELRGCIGHLQARMPLYQAVIEMAASAAVEDYRFSPVKSSEMPEIEIEISVLSPMQKISDYREIRLGIDGVWVRKGFRSGVYLPQVATETGWDLDTFLSSLCAHKAGLEPDAYRQSGTELFIFQVEEFTE